MDSYTVSSTETQDYEVTIEEGDYVVLPTQFGNCAFRVVSFCDDGIEARAMVRCLVGEGRGVDGGDPEEVDLDRVIGVYTNAEKAWAAAQSEVES
jgi:hypothetical protein